MRQRTRRTARLGSTGALAIAAAVVCGASSPLRGDDVRGFIEIRAADSESTEERSGSPVEDSSTDAVASRLFLSFNRQASPWVRFWGGGTFEFLDTTSTLNDEELQTDQQRLSPYLGIGRRTSRWLTQLTWTRLQRKAEPEGLDSVTRIRDSVIGTAAWTPRSEHAPRTRFSATRTYDRDRKRLFQDLVSDFLDLDVNHQVNDKLRWTYRGTRTKRDDRSSQTEITTISHRGDVAYNNAWLNRRVLFGGQYVVTHRNTEIKSSGPGEADIPLFPVEGLAARDDTPLDGALDPAPGLVDDDLVTPTRVDLGLPPPGGDERPWGMGLEFARETTVNALFVWIDRELTPAIAASFDWRVYTSPDNQRWMPRETISGAPYNEILRRFEVRFDDVSERFVKLVVSPLGGEVPGATDFPNIFVTELDAAETIVTPPGGTETSDTSHTLNVNTRARLLANHDLYYEGDFNGTNSSGREATYRYSNGVFYGRPLAETSSLSARVSWNEEQTGRGRDRALLYTTSLNVMPVRRLQYNLSLNGRNGEFADGSRDDQISLFFYGFAGLYQGVDLRLGVGRSYTDDEFGNNVESTQIDFGARVQPRPEIVFRLNYTDSLSERINRVEPFGDILTRTAEANLTYTPVSTLYLYGAYRLEWRDDEDRETVRRWSGSWTPFPQATFRLGVTYDETRRELAEQRQRRIGPFLRWNFNPQFYVQLAYNNLLDESPSRRFKNDTVSAILRWGF